MANGTIAASQLEMLSLSGTGIITITPPATNTNRAITLPDAAGAIVVSGTTPSLNGITFPATQVASSDANTLDDYEEGTWTPNQGGGITLVGTFSSSAKYTKIGRQVTLTGQLQGSTSIAILSNGGILFSNAPFSATPNATGALINDAQSQAGTCVIGGVNNFTTPMSATPIIYFTITHFV